MIKIDSLKISAKKNIDISAFVSEKYKISGKIKDFSILKKSIDARDKADIKYIYSICLKTDEKEESRLVKKYNNIEKYTREKNYPEVFVNNVRILFIFYNNVSSNLFH